MIDKLAILELCFKKPCNKKNANGNYEHILHLKVTLD